MDEHRDDEKSELQELEDARADDEPDEDEEPAMDPLTGGPGLTGLTPPD